jgi:hypothetical protein
MGKAEVKERNIGKTKKYYDVILRHNTGCNEPTETIIAKFTARGDAYMWALSIADRFTFDYQLVVA